MRDWYSSSLRVKLAQAVAEGRADEGRAVELHRLMTGLVGPERQLGADVDGLVRAGRRAPR